MIYIDSMQPVMATNEWRPCLGRQMGLYANEKVSAEVCLGKILNPQIAPYICLSVGKHDR